MNTDDILMCPGPNDIADRVLRAMIRPAACPVTPEFQEFYEQTLDMLAEVYQTHNQVVPLPGSGRSGVESAITSVAPSVDGLGAYILGNLTLNGRTNPVAIQARAVTRSYGEQAAR